MSDQTPATKADLLDLEVRMLQRIEKVETNMLTAFRTWARRSDTRQKAATVLVNSFEERLADLEDQVADLRDKSGS